MTGTIERARIDVEEVRRFAIAAFEAMGVPQDIAIPAGEALVYSEMRFLPGQGQGVRRLRVYAERIAKGLVNPAARLEVVKESPALALVDAHGGMGSMTGIEAMKLAVSKAKTCGIGTVIVRNGTHYGSSAVHAGQAVAANCIGYAFTNAGAEMAPWGGSTPIVGTNPWGIGAPGPDFPVILDIALTTAGKGMMRWHEREGRKMPLDWALTPDGRETDDPTAAMAGALLGIGQYKGYGLSFMSDVMTGVLSGGGFGLTPYSDPARQDVSHSFTAIDIEWFMPLDAFRARMAEFIAMIRSSALRPGFSEVLVPGELEDRRERRARANGILLDRAVLEDLDDLASGLGIQRLQETMPA
jgi:LDH2 family malate/lactate/ureidoglycolate dehydrogenase